MAENDRGAADLLAVIQTAFMGILTGLVGSALGQVLWSLVSQPW